MAVEHNNIDVAYARSRGIVVTNTPDVLTESVADFTWALILAITRRLSEGERLVRRGEWKGWALDFMLGTELRGKQLGLVGVGRIGRAVAARASAFGMRVAYTSREKGHPVRDRLATFARADCRPWGNVAGSPAQHVGTWCPSMPLTEDTRHLIDQRALARMKRSAYLVNIARAGGRRGGAGLGARPAPDCGRRARRLRARAGGQPGPADARDRAARAAPGSATTETRTAMANLAVDNVLEVLSQAVRRHS